MAVWPNGIVGSGTGAYRGVSGVPVITSRSVYFVSSTDSRASDTHPGTEEEEPKATLASAISAASAGDIILVKANHVEDGTNHDLNLAGLLVIGQGSSSSRPQFSGTGADNSATFLLSAAGAMIRNLRIWGADQDGFIFTNSSVVTLEDTGNAVIDCQINMGTERSDGSDLGEPAPSGIRLAGTASRPILTGNELVKQTESESVSASTQNPAHGVLFAVASPGARIYNNTFNGGTQGFDLGAIHVPNGVSVVDLYLQGNTFSNGADVLTDGTGSIRGWGYLNDFNVGCAFSNDANRFRYYENGLTTGEVGHAALTSDRFWHSGTVYYVDSSNTNASDSAPGSGTIRTRPLASLAQAQTNATANNGDLVVIERGHRETLTSPLVLSKSGIVYLGMGTGDDRALFTLADDPGPPITTPNELFDLSGANIWIGNFRLNSTVVNASHTELVELSAAGQVVDGCAFTQGTYDEYAIQTTALATEAWIRNNTFTRDGLPAAVENHAIGLGHTAEGYTVVEDNILDPTASYFWGATGVAQGGITDVSASMGSVHILGNTFRNGCDVLIQNAGRVYLVADNHYDAGASAHT